MDLRKLTDDISVAPQIEAADVPALKAAGFAAIVCHRPDGEAPGQPAYAEIEAEAKAAGLEVRYQPVISGQLRQEDVSRFAVLLAELPKPVLAYCRSGTRSAFLWALAEAGARPAEDIIGRGRAAGYDLSPLAAHLAQAGRKG